MKLFTSICLCMLGAYMFTGCVGCSGRNDQLDRDTLKAGEKPVYSENGKLQFIVEYKNGKANGRVREYTPDGKLYMDATYKEDHRDGRCTHYFPNGVPFEVANYVNGNKDGILTKFYNNGKVLATLVYKNNMIQPGLKEYRKDGTEINDDTELIVKEVNRMAREGKYFFQVSLSKPQKSVEYYVSQKTDPDKREKLKQTSDAGILEIPVASQYFVMKDLIFQAEYKTHLGNTRRLLKLYHHTFN